jgi:hypothetical protein
VPDDFESDEDDEVDDDDVEVEEEAEVDGFDDAGELLDEELRLSLR